jgi:two-component system response regulator (stage 0 sporulation protein A)
MDKIRTVIADDNIDFCNIMKEYFATRSNIEVVGVANDGIETLKLLKEHEPDLLVLDIIMPHLDGIGVLERKNQEDISPTTRVVILSAVGQDKITQRAINEGADYYIIKPFDFDIFTKRIEDIFTLDLFTLNELSSLEKSNLENEDVTKLWKIEKDVTQILTRLGVPPHIKGFVYLRRAIEMNIEDADMMKKVTKKLYPLVAKEFETTPSRVERAIRHAIEVTFERSDKKTLNHFFGNILVGKKNKPTNSQFIAVVSERLKFDNKLLDKQK